MRTLRPLFVIAGLAIALSAQGASAQGLARIGAVVRVVKAAKAGGRFVTAKVGASLGRGARVRTGGRSRALLKYGDKSTLKMDELTEVLVTGQRNQRARVLRGRIHANFRGQGTVTGGYAVAAVRGTKLIYIVDSKGKRALVRCYSGNVYVSGAKNPIRTGTATQVLPTELTDPALQETTTDWRGALVRILDGPFKGQESRVTAVDARSGRLTFRPALKSGEAGADEGGTGYLLSKNPRAEIALLTRNHGVTVNQDGSMRGPYKVATEAFAGLSPEPWHTAIEAGYAVASYAGGADHRRIQDDDFAETDAINQVSRPKRRGGDLVIIVPPGDEQGPQSARASSRAARRRQQDPNAPLSGIEEIYLPKRVRGDATDPEGSPTLFFAEPFAIGADEGFGAGMRLRNRFAAGSVFGEVGWRYGNIRGDDQQDITEGYLKVHGNVADVIAGRQHLFLGPANNDDLGSLIGFNTMDAVLIERKFKGGFRQRAGYIFDTQALRNRGFSAAFARGEGLVGQGRWGYSILGGGGSNGGVGASLDVSHPVIAGVFDVYAEGGVTPYGRRLVTGGMYFPAFFRALGIDMFVEYQARSTRERASIRLRRDLGGGLQFVTFLDQNLKGGTTVGGAVVFGTRFH